MYANTHEYGIRIILVLVVCMKKRGNSRAL